MDSGTHIRECHRLRGERGDGDSTLKQLDIYSSQSSCRFTLVQLLFYSLLFLHLWTILVHWALIHTLRMDMLNDSHKTSRTVEGTLKHISFLFSKGSFPLILQLQDGNGSFLMAPWVQKIFLSFPSWKYKTTGSQKAGYPGNCLQLPSAVVGDSLAMIRANYD